MSEDLPVFVPEDTFRIESRGWTVYTGPCPFNDCVRATTKGRRVVVNGEVRTIIAIEAYAKVTEPRLGEIIGLVFEERGS